MLLIFLWCLIFSAILKFTTDAISLFNPNNDSNASRSIVHLPSFIIKCYEINTLDSLEENHYYCDDDYYHSWIIFPPL